MSEVVRVDYIKKIVDEDQELLALVTQSEQNVLLFKLQINIQDSFPPPEFKFASFRSHKLNNPTPCQYAVIANKLNSLRGLINFLCNRKDDYTCFALPQYEHGLKLDPKLVFCPNCSNTTWPLIHLAIALGHKECLEILIDFLEDQGILKDFINLPDDRQRTPLTIAFATGIDEIIDLLFDKGADPYYSHEKDAIMPIVYTCIHHPDKLENATKHIKKHKGGEGYKVFETVEKFFFDDIGFSYENHDENNKAFSIFLREKNIESYNIFAGDKANKDSGPISTIKQDAQNKDIKDNDDGQNVNQENDNNSDDHKCCHPGCESEDTQLINEKWYCDDHKPLDN